MMQLLEKISNHKQLSWLLTILILLLAIPVIIIRAIVLDLLSQNSHSDA